LWNDILRQLRHDIDGRLWDCIRRGSRNDIWRLPNRLGRRNWR
jgi:hypothetical protein